MPMPKAKQLQKMIEDEKAKNSHLGYEFAINQVCQREGISALDMLVAFIDPREADAKSEMSDEEREQFDASLREAESETSDDDDDEDIDPDSSTGSVADKAKGDTDEKAAAASAKQGVATADAAGNTPGAKAESAHDKATTAAGIAAAGTASKPQLAEDPTKKKG